MNQTGENINCSPLLLRLKAEHGLDLELLSAVDRLALVAVLSRYVYYQQCLIEEYTIADAITDTIPDMEDNICTVFLAIEGISAQTAQELIKLLSAR
jgi:VIT1/CCC1 family predicted Fe2+/Mn2+ transporter